MDKRKKPAIQLLPETAISAFRAWDQKADKIKY
jgi:hypothetical protein